MATIYSITSDKGNKVYIGSTTMSLLQRKYSHKSKSNGCYSNILFNEYGFDNCIFMVIEECPLEERFVRERFHIENIPNVVNQKIPYITNEEREQAIKQRNSDYSFANKERIKLQRAVYRQENAEVIKQRKLKYAQENKEKVNKYAREYYAKKKQSNAL